MADLLNVTINVSQAGLGKTPTELEERSLLLADEMRSGRLVESASLARQQRLPEGAKAGLLATVGGVLTTEISRETLKRAIAFLGHRFPSKAITFSYKKETDGTTHEFAFTGNPEQIEEALSGIAQFEDLQIKVAEKQNATN